MLNTFFKELITQSNTAFNFGTRLIVLRGRRTRSTRNDFIVLRFSPPELPLKINEIDQQMDIIFPLLNIAQRCSIHNSTYIISITAEVRAHDTTNMSMAFQSSLRYEPGCKISP